MPTASQPNIVVFDLDGTLALIEHRRHFVSGERKSWSRFFAACVDDEPNTPVIRLAQMLAQRDDLTLLCFSGRSDEVRSESQVWLDKHVGEGVFNELRMRRQGDYTPDDELKRAWAKPIADRILFTVDDRDKVVAMWRDLGVTCLQVAEGDF